MVGPVRARQGGYGRQFTALFAAGALGVAAIIPGTVGLVRAQMEAAGGAPPPPPLLFLLASLQPLLLLALMVALGTWLAPRLGLRSHLAERAARQAPRGEPLRRSVPLALALGAATALVLVALDGLTLPALGEAGARMSLTGNRTLGTTLAGVLYGGVTEELIVRWGLMSGLATIGTRLTAGGAGRPGSWTMWTAIVLAAVLFGAGHLPAVVGQGIEATGPVIARTIGLNALAGVVFGWLFWRRSLEAAMVAHATVHLVWTGIGML